jgi:bacillolysin
MHVTARAFARTRVCALALAAIGVCVSTSFVTARQTRAPLRIATGSGGEVRQWEGRIRSLQRSGDLRLRERRADTLVRGRSHERLDQFHRGVRVYGADVAQQEAGGQLVSVFGRLYEDIDAETTPRVERDAARAIVERRAGTLLGPRRQPELVVLPLDDGRFVLAWRLRAAAGSDVREYFIDANTGAVALEFSVRKTQSAVGRATGVLGDSKKISVTPNAGRFLADDSLRPPAITTYDLRGDFNRALDIINGFVTPTINDIASDTDNVWTDGAAGDAHIYSGWTYDYYFKRFGRRGLDNADLAIRSIVHPVRRQDFDAAFDIVPDFFLNAAYYGQGLMVYGVGLPPGLLLSGNQTVDFFSGALDVVAHELTHGVTEYSANFIYLNESGALDEGFSDIMGTSIERFFQPEGTGLMQADYLIGEDIVRPGGIRSMSDPGAFGDPDHYSRRFTGSDDNGGVHINSGIVNQAFFLAVEGGANRTSGIVVQGVGGGSREQMERVFYRAFTQMLPASATFSMARAATIQSARDLFGAGSAAERAVTGAWTAVGVN